MEIILGGFLKVTGISGTDYLIQLSQVTSIHLSNSSGVDDPVTVLDIVNHDTPLSVKGDVLAFLSDLDVKQKQFQQEMRSRAMFQGQPNVVLK